MSDLLLARIVAWPYDDHSGGGTEIGYISGRITKDMFQYGDVCRFSRPLDFDFLADDYTDHSATLALLQRGAKIQVQFTDDGSFAGAHNFKRFTGYIWEWGSGLERSGGTEPRQVINYTAYSRLHMLQRTGIYAAPATRHLHVEVSATSSDFDDNFILNIPMTSETEGYDYVPGTLEYLVATYEEAGEVVVKDYNPDEYIYRADTHQIIFIQDQDSDPHDGSGWLLSKGTRWDIIRAYYDPTDTSNSVKQFLTDVFTGDALGEQGGLSIASGDLNLDEVVSFDGTSPKLIRKLFVDATDGSISQVFDNMKDQGLLPVNYYIRENYETEKIDGSYIYQDNSNVLQLESVSSENPFTIAGIPAIVECHSTAIIPQNFALQAAVSLSANSTFLADYEKVGDEENINDGDGGSFVQFQRQGALLNDPVQGSPKNLLVADICSAAGAPAYRDIRRITWRGSAPKELIGQDYIDIPNYYTRQKPRVTIVASMTPITEDNPGIAVSDDAKNIPVEISQIDGKFDIDVTCENIRHMRYIGIWFPQEGHFRRSDKNTLTGTVARMGYFATSEISAYGKETVIYPDGHPDERREPFVQVTTERTDVTAVTSTTEFQVENASGEANWITAGTMIQVLVGSTPIQTTVLTATPAGDKVDLEVDTAVTGIMVGDEVGWRRRWVFLTSGLLFDTRLPSLRSKMDNCGILQKEIVETEESDNVDFCEALAADRLYELLAIHSDHEEEVKWDPSLEVGSTASGDTASGPYLTTRLDEVFTRGGVGPRATARVNGTNYEGTNE